MKTVLKFLVAAIVVVAVAWFVSLVPGAISARIGDTVFQASTPVAILLAAIAFLVLYAIVRLIVFIIRLPRRNRRMRQARRRLAGDDSVTRTLVALAAGNAGAARSEAARGRALLGDTPLTLLLAAQAARQAGDEGDAAKLFQRLAEPKPKDRTNTAFLGLRGLFRQAIERQDWTEAARLAAQAERAQPGAAWLREERAQLAVRTGQWRDAMRLGETSAAVVTGASLSEENGSAARKLARQAFEADPSLPTAALAYAARLRLAGKERAAQDVLRRCWALTPHPDLATAALAPLQDPLARVRAAKEFVQMQPDSADSHLLQGRMSLEAGLTGEARRHAAAAQAAGMTQRRLHLLLADIAEAEGDPAAARAAMRDEAAATADPAWVCQACGTVHPVWHPACPACGTAGGIHWATPLSGPVPANRLIARPVSREGVLP